MALDSLFPPPLPDPSATGATVVLARDGQPLRAFPDAGGVWRHWVNAEEVSPLYIEALLGYEDRWFWWHPGVNPASVLRALGQALRHGRAVSGASTLSMQVARLIEPQAPGIAGKLKQSLRALQLEWRLDKREILELYLNHAPFGGAIEGVEAASWAYLGKPAAALSHAEAALLAVLPQAPSRLRPDRHPERARAARDKVLHRLQTLGIWSGAEVTDALVENVVARRLAVPQHAALLAEHLRQQHPGQRRIRSGIDAALQLALEERIQSFVERLPPRTSAALLLVDNDSGEVRAYVGSARFGDRQRFGHLDMVQAWRSPGSTLKPFAYGLAMDAGLIHAGSLLIDAPQDFDGYRPENFDQHFRGPISVAEALQQSLNVPAVAVLQQLGPARFAARLEHAGLRLRLPNAARPHLAMILGATEVRLLDLVGAFAALHRQGRSLRPKLTPDAPLESRQLLSTGAAWIIAELLRAPQHSDNSPFMRSAGSLLAYKTGTSYGFRDSWAIGGTAAVTLGVWVGRPDGTPSPGQFGAITALPLLLSVAESLPKEYRAGSIARPANVVPLTTCWPLGGAEQKTRAEHCHRRLPSFSLNGALPRSLAPAGEAEPPRAQSLWLDPRSGHWRYGDCRRGNELETEIALWPRLASAWLSPTERAQGSPPPLAPDCEPFAGAEARLLITGAREGSHIRPPAAGMPAPVLQLRAAGAVGHVNWLLNGRLLKRLHASTSLQHAFESPGPQEIVAIDDSGQHGRLRMTVQELRPAAP